MTSAGARGTYAKTPARRAQIIERASEVFSARGFQGASLTEIAQAVGLTQPGLMHHFGSKEELLMAVLDKKDAGTLADYDSGGRSPLDTLRQVVRDNAGQPGLIRLYTTLAAEALQPQHPAHEYFRRRGRRARALIAYLLRQARTEGDLPAGLDVERTAAVVMAVMDGLQLQWLLDPAFDMVAAFEAYLDTLTRD